MRMTSIERCQRSILGAIRRQLGEVVERDRNAKRAKRADVSSCGFSPPAVIPKLLNRWILPMVSSIEYFAMSTDFRCPKGLVACPPHDPGATSKTTLCRARQGP